MKEHQQEWACGICGTVSDRQPYGTPVSPPGAYSNEQHRNIPYGRDWNNQPLPRGGARVEHLVARNGPRDPMYRLRQEFDRDITPHLYQFLASTADVVKCRELYFSLRTTDKEVLEKHYNCTSPLAVTTNLSEKVRSALWAIVLMAEIERDPRHLDEKIGDLQFTYPISGRISNHIQTSLESLRGWWLSNDESGVMDDVCPPAIGFIKSIHQRLNFMFKNSSLSLGAQRQRANEDRKQQLNDMFIAMNKHYGLKVDLALVERMFPLLLEVDRHPSSGLKYPNPVNDRASMLKSCHLEIVLAVCKRLYPEKKFTRPKVCKAFEAYYGFYPKYSNSKRLYGKLATYLVERMLNQEEVKT